MRHLLARQVRKTLGSPPGPESPVGRLLQMVQRSYEELGQHRRMVERSLQLASDELHDRNQQLQLQLEAVNFQAWLLSNMHDAALLLDRTGEITLTFAATEAIFCCAGGSMIGHPLADFVGHGDPPVDFDGLVRLALAGQKQTHDFVIACPDRGERVVEITLTVLDGIAVDGQWLFALAHDITERRRVHQQLIHSQKLEAIGQLAAGIAHEINTPAQYVTDNLHFLDETFRNLLTRTAPMTAEEREFIAAEAPVAIRQSLEGMTRIADIVQGIKLFAHPGSGEMTVIDLAREITAVIAVSRNEWKYVATVTTDIEPDLPPVETLHGELRQVLLNLIVNAAQAIGDGGRRPDPGLGRIHVAARRLEDRVEISVSDNGPGIPERVRDRIFDPFFTTKPVGKGTGQGLAISRSIIVDHHHGTLTFESTDGAGTTFRVGLPVRVAGEQKPAA